jgi:hypothetical protein
VRCGIATQSQHHHRDFDIEPMRNPVMDGDRFMLMAYRVDIRFDDAGRAMNRFARAKKRSKYVSRFP